MTLWKVDVKEVGDELYELEMQVCKIEECLRHEDWESPQWLKNALRKDKLELNRRIVELRSQK